LAFEVVIKAHSDQGGRHVEALSDTGASALDSRHGTSQQKLSLQPEDRITMAFARPAILAIVFYPKLGDVLDVTKTPFRETVPSNHR
jgi:hypothetical protein